MSRQCPKQVWVSWCDECGQVDYAYNVKPARGKPDPVPGCPKCETGPEYQHVAGPYILGPEAKTT